MGMLCFPRATHLAHYLLQTATVPGAVAEFGCHQGRTAAFMTALTKKHVYVYDSFAGLPPPSEHDRPSEVFHEGAMAISPQELVDLFKRLGLRTPIIEPGFFKDLQPHQLPKEIAFAHLDGDFYESIAGPLYVVWPRLSPGGYIVVDDWDWDQLPGVTDAVKAWSKDIGIKPEVQYGTDGAGCHQAVLHKPS